jgi:hypothetical protein
MIQFHGYIVFNCGIMLAFKEFQILEHFGIWSLGCSTCMAVMNVFERLVVIFFNLPPGRSQRYIFCKTMSLTTFQLKWFRLS